MTPIDHTAYTGISYQPYLDFWKRNTENCLAGFQFTQQKKSFKSQVNQPDYKSVSFEMEHELSKKVFALVNENNLGIYTVMLAGLSVLFHKYTTNQCIVLKSPVLPGTGKKVVDNVPMIIPLVPSNSWKQHLIDVQGVVKDTYRYQHFPLALVSDKKEDNQICPSNISVTFSGLHTITDDSSSLAITFEKTEQGLKASIRFDQDLFHEGFIKNMWQHFSNLLKNLNNLENKLQHSTMFSEEERSHLLEGLNGDNRIDHTAYDRTIIEVFEESVAKHGDRIAVTYNGNDWTYKELNEMANQLAHYLRAEYHVQPNDIVALMLPRSEWMIVGILGILKAGGAFLPIDATYPMERKAYILNDAGVKLLLTHSDDMFDLSFYSGALFAMDIQIQSLTTPKSNPELSNKPGDLAYVIYTSGSTGKPKGVLLEHRGEVNMTLDQLDRFGVVKEDHVLQFASFSFDASVYEIFMALYAGAKLVLIDKETIGNTRLFENYLQSQAVSVITLPPAYLSTLNKDNLHSIRVLITAGESANIEDAIRCSQFADYYNAYGPTECSVCVTTRQVKPSDAFTETVPIGKSISNMRSYILNDQGDLTPRGLVGELCVSGVGLARGYVNRPDLTENYFKYHSGLGERLYYTGDLVRWNYEGELEYIGRKDDQFKLRGYRVEPEEVARTLSAHPGINEAVVLKTEGDSLAAIAVPDKKNASPLYYLLNHKETAKYATLPNGLVAFYKNKFEVDVLYDEIFVDRIYHRCGLTINDGDIVFDVGANIGLFSLYTGLYYDNVQVFAFEPVPEVFEIMKANTQLYNINVKAFDHGLSNEEQKISFTYYPNNTALSSRYGDLEKDKQTVRQAFLNRSEEIEASFSNEALDNLVEDRVKPRQIECNMRRISDLIKEHGVTQIDLLKIDVERSEWEVLQGIDESDWNKIRQIVVEIHDENDALAKIENTLKVKGYSIVKEQASELEQTDLYNLYAFRPENAVPRKEQKELEINTHNGIWANEQQLITALKAYAAEQLPDYMVPAAIHLVPGIPLTANGKVDKKALIKINSAARPERQNYKAPGNETEEKLVTLWEDILNKNSIGVNEDFFELGGHSLKATLLISRIYKEMQVEIDLGSVFLNPTIEKLAKIISESHVGTYNSIPKAALQEYYELSFAQRRLWILNQFPESRKAYLMPNVHLLKDIDITSFKSAIYDLIARHESLRTNFITIEGEPKQKIHEADTFNFEIEEIDLRDAQDRDQIVAAMISKESEIEFDLSTDPLLRAKLIRIQDASFVFLLTMHHIITDGWSVNILIKELFELYKAKMEGRPNPLPELKIQYKDYAVWQKEQLEKGVLEAAADYWAKTFKEVPTLNLPTDFPRPAVKNYKGSYIGKPIGQNLSQAFRSWCNDRELSVLMGLSAVVKTLLYKYSGQSDIVVGTTVSGRNHPDLEKQNGFYVNTLALKTTFNPNATFDKLGDKVKETILGAFKYEQYPFDLLLDKLDLKRDTSRSPLFDVLVEVLNINPYGDGQGTSSKDGNNYTPAHITSKYDLSFKLGTIDDSFTIYIEYNTDLFTYERIERMLLHFQELVKAVLTDSTRALVDLEYMPEEEKKALYQFNHSSQSFEFDKTVIELFDDQVAKTPLQNAIVFGETCWTYEELSAEINRIAIGLVKTEPFPENKRIGIMVERSNRMVAAILAVLRVGGSFVFIDPGYPDNRKQYILEDSNITLLIIESGQMLEVESIYDKALYVLDIQMSENEGEKGSLPGYPSLDNLAYQLYTSGSTGKPKGVKIRHQSIANYVSWANQYYFENQASYHFPLFTSMSFDLTLTSLFSPLLRGGTLVVCEDKPVDQLLREIFTNETLSNVVKLTPSHIDLLKSIGLVSTNVAKVIVGGEALKTHHVFALKQLNPAMEIYNEYGPTETTVGSSVKKITEAHQKITIGKPIANTNIYILDDGGKILPVGVDGELYIGGAGVAAGYCNQEKLTAAKFIKSPISNKSNDILYKTGDLGRWTTEGDIVLLGRKDHQVKIRGFRIELEEIETALIKHEAIQNAAVVAVEQGEGQELIAYIESDDKELSLTALRTYLSRLVPDYMVPAEFVYIEKIPVTNNGKTDRIKLKQIDSGERLSQQEYVPPSNAIEEKLVAIWQSVLGKEKIGITDDFFSLGGHSLKATQIVMRTYQELDCEIDISSLFTSPTIAGLAQVIAEKDKSIYKEIEPVEGEEHYVLSPAQKRLWITEQLTEGLSVYNSYGSYLIEGKLDEAVVESVFQTLVQRHEVLRTVFEVIEGEPRQKIKAYDPADYRINRIDLREEDDKKELAATYSKKAATDSFNLFEGPLIRITLLRLEEEKFVFYFTLHHIISDGWSMNILVSEFSILYQAYSEGKENPLVPLRIHYKDYATWLEKQLNDEKNLGHKAYWRTQLEGDIPILALPLEKPRPKEKTYNGDAYSLWLENDLKNELTKLGAANGASLFMVLLGAFKSLLYRYTQQEDIVIGTVETGRNHPDLAKQIGIYVNTLALRTKLEGSDSFELLLHKIKETVLGAYQHAMYPFDKLLEDLEITWEKNHSPLFDIAFSLENLSGKAVFDDTAESDDVNAQGNNDKVWSNIFDLVVNAKEFDKGVMVNFHYNTDLFSERYIILFAKHFKQLAQNIVSNSQNKVAELPYMSEDEMQDLAGFNETNAPFPETELMHTIFERKAAENPGQIAVVCNEKRLTYSDLNKSANRMAHYLRKEINILPNDIVAIMLDKSDQALVAILAVLKAGAAYLPIDPEYPQERIDFILKDSCAKLLITHSDYRRRQTSFEEAVFVTDLQLDKLPKEDSNPDLVNSSEDSAYVIYTSGSTGLPKGVIISHKANINMALDQIERFSVRKEDNVLQFASLSFDASVYEMFMALYAGATLVVADKHVVQSTDHFLEYISSNNVSITTLPPAYLRILDIDQLQFIRVMITAGEAANVSDAVECSKYMEYYNAYGPTEAAVCVSVYKVSEADKDRIRIPIGKPINNTEMHILDQNGQPVPMGVEGELFIAGPGLAKGYLNRPALTAEKFFELPGISENRLYKTGDICKRLPNGSIDFVGRNDDQVKINGFRIEMGEITNIIREYKTVEDAYVFVEKNGEDKRILAFAVPGLSQQYPEKDRQSAEDFMQENNRLKDAVLLRQELLTYCQAMLPYYMLPNEIIVIDELPVTINGKVDKKLLLRKANEIKAPVNKEIVLPRNKYEERIVNIWKEILHLDQEVDVTKNFFELGGNSLKATQIVTQLNKLEKIEFQVTDVFQYNTVESFAKLMEISAGNLSELNDSDIDTKSYTKTMLFLGTSLTAGYGVDAVQSFPSLIQDKLNKVNSGFKVINAGLTGETSIQGKNRLKWVLDHKIDVFVLELGANDGPAGVPLAETRNNLQEIIDNVKDKNKDVTIVLAGMQVPSSFGKDYTDEFNTIFSELAISNNIPIIPYLLEGVAEVPELNLKDGVHPNAEGHKMLAENVWAVLKEVVLPTNLKA
jgi:amino acid adenylation domain-containing protein/FkbM family methyltransferase